MRGICVLALLLCLAVLGLPQVESKNGHVTRRVCEYSDIHIYCFGRRKIRIIDALYGRTSKIYCWKWYGFYWSTTCKAVNSMEKVMELCDGKKSCTVLASDSVFADPCSSTEKYLEIKYRCA